MLTQTDRVLATYSKRGTEGQKVSRMYRQLFKPELYMKAYSQIYANAGALKKAQAKTLSMECH